MEQNTHWQEWREAVKRCGFTPELKLASERLRLLDQMTPVQIEALFAGMEKITNVVD